MELMAMEPSKKMCTPVFVANLYYEEWIDYLHACVCVQTLKYHNKIAKPFLVVWLVKHVVLPLATWSTHHLKCLCVYVHKGVSCKGTACVSSRGLWSVSSSASQVPWDSLTGHSWEQTVKQGSSVSFQWQHSTLAILVCNAETEEKLLVAYPSILFIPGPRQAVRELCPWTPLLDSLQHHFHWLVLCHCTLGVFYRSPRPHRLQIAVVCFIDEGMRWVHDSAWHLCWWELSGLIPPLLGSRVMASPKTIRKEHVLYSSVYEGYSTNFFLSFFFLFLI